MIKINISTFPDPGGPITLHRNTVLNVCFLAKSTSLLLVTKTKEVTFRVMYYLMIRRSRTRRHERIMEGKGMDMAGMDMAGKVLDCKKWSGKGKNRVGEERKGEDRKEYRRG